jgi:myo-inositol 2-dehydrogenase/D-chiro-inositol 1-dehydrogenase
MVTAGGPQETSATSYTAAGINSATVRLNVDLFHDAYTAELAHFVDSVKAGRDGIQAPSTQAGRFQAPVAQAPGGTDARNALAVALAAFRSAETGLPVDVASIAVLRPAEPAPHLVGNKA